MDDENLKKIQNILALNIKRKRKGLSLSQEALAHEANIDRTYVSQLERSLVNPSLAVLLRLATVLKCSTSSLLEIRDT
jgi:transcriptional regulator with XRE-family HTH domain